MQKSIDAQREFFLPIIKNENVKCHKGIYNRQIKKVMKSYQKNQG